MLAAELSRMEREPVSLCLFVFGGSTPAHAVSERTAIAELGDRRFAALLTRRIDVDAREALLSTIGDTVRADGFAGGGLLDIRDGAATSFEARSLLSATERAFEFALRSAPGGIEQITVLRQALPLSAAEPVHG
jgi:hypothetical protein